MADTCAELLASCDCTKDAGHVEAGDPVHECSEDCGGRWSGEHPHIMVLRYPRPSDPAFAHLAAVADRANEALPAEGVPYVEPQPLRVPRGGIRYGGAPWPG